MKQSELKSKIKLLAKQILSKPKEDADAKEAVEYYEFYKFPELKKVIVSLLTPDFNAFISSVDWVAPRPTTFRINLKNDHEFYLMWNDISWIAQVEGKKYYLLNLSEEQHAAEAISRVLKYLSNILKEKITKERSIYEKWILRDEDGNPVPLEDENGEPIKDSIKISDMRSFENDINEFMNLNNEIPFEKIDINELNLQSVKIKDIIKIEFLFI